MIKNLRKEINQYNDFIWWISGGYKTIDIILKETENEKDFFKKLLSYRYKLNKKINIYNQNMPYNE